MAKVRGKPGLNVAAVSEKLDEAVRPKTVPPPSTVLVGEHMQMEDGSVWRVERVSPSCASVVCVGGTGEPELVDVVKTNQKTGESKTVQFKKWRGHKPGEMTQVTTSRVGVRFVPPPEKREKSEPVTTHERAAKPAQETPDMSTKTPVVKTEKTPKAKAPKVAKPKSAAKPAKKESRSKWTDEKLAKMKTMRKEGKTIVEIAKHFGVSDSVIWVRLNDYKYDPNAQRPEKRAAAPARRAKKVR